MRHVLIAALQLILFHGGVHAQSDAHMAKVRELVGLMAHDTMFRVSVETVLGQQLAASMQQLDQIASQTPENAERVEASKQKLTERHERMLGLFWKHIDFDAFREQVMVPLYARHFTEGEVSALIEFYRSPVGRKFVELTPQLLNESNQANARFFDAASERVNEELQDDVARKADALRTMGEMRMIGTHIGFLQEEADPATLARVTGVAELLPLTEEFDLPGGLKAEDGRGRPFLIVFSPDAMRYRIVSAGADGVFETTSRTLGPPKQPTVWTDSLDADLIWEDGAFAQLPAVARWDADPVRK